MTKANNRKHPNAIPDWARCDEPVGVIEAMDGERERDYVLGPNAGENQVEFWNRLSRFMAKEKYGKDATVSDPMLSLPQVMTMTGLSKETIRTTEQAGTFPKRTKLGSNRIGWRCSRIAQWVLDREKESEEA